MAIGDDLRRQLQLLLATFLGTMMGAIHWRYGWSYQLALWVALSYGAMAATVYWRNPRSCALALWAGPVGGAESVAG